MSADRVVRRVAGLRPFRPSGFVVRAEPFGDRLLVHNYGHGGGGVTLSWGTAALAIAALEGWTGGRHACAVVGAGVVGLATARLLQQRGLKVTIYARDVSPNTTSDVAGAQWGPFGVFDSGTTTPEFDAQFVRAARISWRMFQDLPGSPYGIRSLHNYELSDSPFTEPLPRHLYADAVDLGPELHPFPARHARRYTAMLIEMPVYMAAMLRDVQTAGGRIAVQEFASIEQIAALKEPVVFNCTGLGARALFGDSELIPAKGQLAVLPPQPEVDYVTLLPDVRYMFPRRDGILLGGSFERGVWTPEPDVEVERAILDAHRRLFEAMR